MPIGQAEKRIMGARGWLAHVPDTFRAEVFSRCSLSHYKPGQLIYDLGDPVGGLRGLLGGRVEVLLGNGEDQHVLAHVAQPGDWFGDYAVFTRKRRMVGLRIKTAVRLLHLPLPAIDDMVAVDPGAWRWFGMLPVTNLQAALLGVEDLMQRDSRRRCLAVLSRLAIPEQDADGALVANVSQDDLATMCNLSRSAVAAYLADFEREKLIKRGYGQIRILHPASMRGY